MYTDYNNFNQFYGFNDYNMRDYNMRDYNLRSTEQMKNTYDDELISPNQAIELIRTSVGNEREDELFYDNLIKIAPTDKEKDIIKSIRDDERKHNKILRELYYNFTGQMIPPDTLNQGTESKLSYKELLEKALFGELDAVVKYRKILGKMPSGDSYILLMSIMTDEIKHANKYNFLIATAK